MWDATRWAQNTHFLCPVCVKELHGCKEEAIRKPVDESGKGGGEDGPTTIKHIGMKSLIKW